MTNVREDRVQELAQSNYLMLKETYQGLGTLRELIRELHDSGLTNGGIVEFEKVEAVTLTFDEIYAELERYLRPECDPDSADDGAIAEVPPPTIS